MAKFKCLLSGNTIELTDKVDIDSMEGHEGYIRLEDEVAPVKAVSKKQSSKAQNSTPVTSEAE